MLSHRARKHIQQQYRPMQSVLPRRRQHAISYVLARGSMDRVDRAQGIRLIARASPVCLPPISLSLSLLLTRRTIFSLFPSIYFSLSLVPHESERRIFAAETIFNSDRRPPSRSRRCIRTSASARITADAIRNCGEFATLALNTLRRRAARRAAVTSQSELQTKRLAARPNTRAMCISRDTQFLIPAYL